MDFDEARLRGLDKSEAELRGIDVKKLRGESFTTNSHIAMVADHEWRAELYWSFLNQGVRPPRLVEKKKPVVRKPVAKKKLKTGRVVKAKKVMAFSEGQLDIALRALEKRENNGTHYFEGR